MCYAYVGVGVKYIRVHASKDDTSRDFLGGSVIKNPSCHARDTAAIRGHGTRIPQVSGQLSPHATTTEPTHSRASILQLESITSSLHGEDHPTCRN